MALWQVPVRGRDADLSVNKGTVKLLINAVSTWAVPLADIDCLQETNTYRRVEIRSGILQQKYITSFKFWFRNLTFGYHRRAGDTTTEMTRYPQRHVVDLQIVGANGNRGFLPMGRDAGYVATWTNNPGRAAISMTGMITIYGRYNYGGQIWPGQNPTTEYTPGHSSDAGSNPRYWTIHEDNGWTNSVDRLGDSINFTRMPVNTRHDQYYTRNSHFLAQVKRGMGGAEAMNIARACHLFYSPSNVVVFRFEFDIVDYDLRICKITKYTGGYAYT